MFSSGPTYILLRCKSIFNICYFLMSFIYTINSKGHSTVPWRISVLSLNSEVISLLIFNLWIWFRSLPKDLLQILGCHSNSTCKLTFYVKWYQGLFQEICSTFSTWFLNRSILTIIHITLLHTAMKKIYLILTFWMYLINYSLEVGLFPESIQISKITPIHESGEPMILTISDSTHSFH